MRAESERAFQTGGLAAVTPPLDEEEDTLSVSADFDPADYTGTEEMIEEVKPDPLAELRQMATMTKDDALARLRESRDSLAERRSRQQRNAETDRWLALAQGMLSPTKTGAFGENLGYAAEGLRGANAQAFEQEEILNAADEDIAEREYKVAGDYFDSLANLEGFKNNSRARVVGLRDIIAPHDRKRIESGDIDESEAERNIVSIIMNPDGSTVGELQLQADGQPWVIAKPSVDPSQAAAQEAAKGTATLAVQTAGKQAMDGIQLMPAVLRLRRAHNLLMTLDENTSGLKESIRKVAMWAGITDVIDDSTTLAKLHRMFGDQVLSDLMTLTGTKTDFEYKKMEELNAGLGKGIAENLAILDTGMTKMGEIINRGEYSAQMLAETPANQEAQLWKQQYLRFQKENAELNQVRETTTRVTVPQAALDDLMRIIGEQQGDPEAQKQTLNTFRNHFEIPQELVVPLRELGAPL